MRDEAADFRFVQQKNDVMVCLESKMAARWLCRPAFIQFLKGHECDLKTKFLPAAVTTLGTNITISRSLLSFHNATPRLLPND